jgi:hypothetical protein
MSPYLSSLLVSSLAYTNLLGTKGYVVVAVPLLTSYYFSWFLLSVYTNSVQAARWKYCMYKQFLLCIGSLLGAILIKGDCLHSQSSSVSDGI